MHDLWNFSPPPAMSSSSSSGDDDGEDVDYLSRERASGKSFDASTSDQPTSKVGEDPDVVILDTETPEKSAKISDSLDLDSFVQDVVKDKKSPKKRSKAAQSKSKAKIQKILSANARSMASLREEDLDDVDDFIEKVHKSAAEEEERKRSAQAATVSSDDEDLDLFGTELPSVASLPKDTSTGEKLVLVVALPNKAKHEFRISKQDKLSKVLNKMEEILGKEKNFILTFDGDKLQGNETPESLDMDEGDTIDLHFR